MADAQLSLQTIQNQFDSLKTILDQDQRHYDNLIQSIRKEIHGTEDVRSAIELADQLNYFEEEAVKTHEENKKCLMEKFQILFRIHQDGGAEENLRAILRDVDAAFQQRPSVVANLEKLLSTSKQRLTTTTTSRSFCNRADVQAFQRAKQDGTSVSVARPAIESNEIDLTKLIRETSASQDGSDRFRFSNLSNSHQFQQQQQQRLSGTSPTMNLSTSIHSTRLSGENVLLLSASKHYVLLHNVDLPDRLYIDELQSRTIKEQQWDEGAILSLGYVDNHLFYLITSTKIFLYDLIKESIVKQYFLYDSLYKDLLLIKDDPAFRTALKRTNQIQSVVDDDYCYYLYLTRDYEQVLIKCSLIDFHPVFRWNLHQHFPSVQCFLGFTVNQPSLITFLVQQDARYQLIFCDESCPSQPLKRFWLDRVQQAEQIQSTSLINLPCASRAKRWNYSSKKSHQHLWFILDRSARCVHCVNYDNIDKQIDFHRSASSLESISIIDKQQLLVAFNPFDIQLIDLDQCLSS